MQHAMGTIVSVGQGLEVIILSRGVQWRACMIREGSKPYLDQLLGDSRRRQYTRLRDDARYEIGRLSNSQSL
jgi:hypothetical protein